MSLTIQSSKRDPDKFPTVQLFLLGKSRILFSIVRLAEPIALTSIFPYAWPLVKKFHVGNEQDASFYAGLLISTFALAEALTGMYWGGLSDKVGRKPVLLVGCAGTMLSMIMVGFASNIWMALLGRALGGFLNGNIGVIQTMVGELVTKPEHEPRAYSVMPFVWAIGTIIGPTIGGTFADPATSFPNIFSPQGLFARFPYLLPNLLCATLLFISILAGYFLLEETHPDMRPRASLPDQNYVSEETPLVATADAIKTPAVDLRAETYGTFHDSLEQSNEAWLSQNPKAEPCKVFTKQVVALVIALGIFSYHSMTYDHLLPIFLEDQRADPVLSMLAVKPIALLAPGPGGLGLSLRTVGMIMSVNGLIALVIQAVIFPILAECCGVFRLFIIVSTLHPVSYFIMPYLLLLPPNFLFAGIYSCLFIRNILQIVAYPLLLILIKAATPSKTVLGRINGLAASAGAASRTIAPPIAGYLYTIGTRLGSSGFAWYGSGIVAVVGALQCFMVMRAKKSGCDTELGEVKSEVLTTSVTDGGHNSH